MISSTDAKIVPEGPVNIGLINVSNQSKTEQSTNGLVIPEQQFHIDDELRTFFQNEMHAHRVSSNECDSSVVR